MSIATELTVQKLTPPGYFDLSVDAASHHRDYMTWFQQQLTFDAENVAVLRELVINPWLVDFADSPRIPWLSYLLRTYGIGAYDATNNQCAALYKLASGSWSTSALQNMEMILDTFCLPPFSWFDATYLPHIYSGQLAPSVTDTGFLIYSTASSPSTPADTAYAGRSWTVPTGWTRAPSSAIKYCRGYLSGSNIVWCAPRVVADFSNATYFSAGIPSAVPSAGTVCIVDTDSTGDRRAVYYSDGTAWRKNSLTNINLGLVVPSAGRPDPEAVTVWAPNPDTAGYAIASSVPPPSGGFTQGYGTFAGWSGTTVTNNSAVLGLRQLSGGTNAIATVISMLRRIKPASLNIKINISGTEYDVGDARAVS